MNIKNPMDDIRIEYELIWTQSEKVFNNLDCSQKIEYCNPNLPYNYAGKYYAIDCLNHTRYKTLHNAIYAFINFTYSQDNSCPVLYTQLETKVIINNKEYDFSDRTGLDSQDGNYTFYHCDSIPNIDGKTLTKYKFMLDESQKEFDCFMTFIKKYNAIDTYNQFKEEYNIGKIV